MSRFDWYAATIGDTEEGVLARLEADLGATAEPGTALHGYEHGYDLRTGGSTVARVLAGGRNGAPHAWASGDDTDRFVDVVRSAWPGLHRVSRMDAAEDLEADGAWDTLFGECVAIAEDRGLRVNQAGDWLHTGPTDPGRTLYLGSQHSAVRVRLYEKGKQLRGLAMDGGSDISPDLVRLEVQVRPEGPARWRAAVGEPDEAFGYADWTRELAARVLALDVERVRIKERRETDDERAIEWLVRQYGEHLERLADRAGGWAAVGDELHRVMERQQARRMGV